MNDENFVHTTINDMIDTITIRPARSFLLTPYVLDRISPRNGWLPPAGGIADLNGWRVILGRRDLALETHQSVNFIHRRLGIVVCTDGSSVKWIQASLPRVLHGSNGIQIKSQEELQRAIDSLRNELDLIEWLVPGEFYVHRLDLVLNLLHPPGKLIALHRHARHPLVRRATKEFVSAQGNTLCFNGAETQVQFYDKRAEVLGKLYQIPEKGSFATRVEVSLGNKKQVCRHFHRQRPISLDKLNFWECYRTWRGILCQFECVDAPPPGSKTAILLASLLQADATVIGGMNPLDWYCLGKAQSTIRPMRKAVHELQKLAKSFSWAKELPENALPPIADVENDGFEDIIL